MVNYSVIAVVNFSMDKHKCPACGSSSFSTIYQAQFDEPPVSEYLEGFYSSRGKVEFEYLTGATYALCECDVCCLLFQRDIPGDQLMEKLYDHWIDPATVLDRHEQAEGLAYCSRYAQEIMQTVSYFGKVPSSLCFLDFGMGWGNWALMAKAFGCDSYGTELSVERVEHAKTNGIKVVTWDEIPHHRFDFINTEQVFEHIPEPLTTLRHLAGALKANGMVRISVPDASDVERRLRRMDWNAPKGSRDSLNLVAPLEHINCFRRSALAQMASEAGMEEVVLPARVQFGHRTDWSGPRSIAKNLLRPIYPSALRRQNQILLRNTPVQ